MLSFWKHVWDFGGPIPKIHFITLSSFSTSKCCMPQRQIATRENRSQTYMTRFSYATKMCFFFFNSGKLTDYLSLKPVVLFILYLSGLHLILKYREVDIFSVLRVFKGKSLQRQLRIIKFKQISQPLWSFFLFFKVVSNLFFIIIILLVEKKKSIHPTI